VIASEESVALIAEIIQGIKENECYLLHDRRIELILDHADDLQMKIQRLRSFARLHHWHVEVHNHGRTALFSSPGHHSHRSTAPFNANKATQPG